MIRTGRPRQSLGSSSLTAPGTLRKFAIGKVRGTISTSRARTLSRASGTRSSGGIPAELELGPSLGRGFFFVWAAFSSAPFINSVAYRI